MAKKKQPDRYERFKAILTDAAGESTADYQGYGQFWNTMSLDRLQKLVLFSVPMFAPKENIEEEADQESALGSDKDSSGSSGSSCCGSSAKSSESDCCSTPADGPKYPGRGEASGIVIAMRGQYPFDSTMFPRFPFGGSKVSDTDIDMISGWIDDGCPEKDHSAKPDDRPTEYDGTIIHPPHHDPNKIHHDSNGLKQRKNMQYIPAHELQNLRLAFRKVFELNQYPLDKRSYHSYAKVHGDSCQHGWEQFLPWHRAYLYEFELNLQDFVPNVTLPYWDWTLPQYKKGIPQAPAKGKSKVVGGIIPPAYRCWLSPNNIKELQKYIEENNGAGGDITPDDLNKIKDLLDVLFNSGIALRWAIEDELGKSVSDQLYSKMCDLMHVNNPLWHASRFPGMFYNTKGKGTDQQYVRDPKTNRPVLAYDGNMAGHFHHHYPTKDEIDGILETPNWADFGGGHYANQSFGLLSQNPHNTGHIWSGGQNPYFNFAEGETSTNSEYGSMFVDLVAFFDPIAWGHHSNVDRMWYLWQQKHKNAEIDDLTAVMMPWHYTVQQLLDVGKLGYEYVMDSKYYGINSDVPVVKLNTKATDVHKEVLENHKKVEVRLHGVRRAVKSHFIKVFLNAPDANHDTPIKENDNFVGYAARFGHGNCVGGPGHCDVPELNRHFFDNRHRHHNTPTNHRFDATEQVKKLIASGAKDIEVNVVVMGPHGKLAEGDTRALMDGISVNFFD